MTLDTDISTCSLESADSRSPPSGQSGRTNGASLLEARLASRLPWPEPSGVKPTHVISGQKWIGLLNPGSPGSSYMKILLERQSWRSIECVLTWKGKGTTFGRRLYFQLVPLVRHTRGIGYGLLPTLRRSGQPRAWKAYKRENYRGNLEEFLGEIGYSGWITRQFAEWMMGYPLDWTDTKALATPSSPKSRRKS